MLAMTKVFNSPSQVLLKPRDDNVRILLTGSPRYARDDKGS